MSALEDLLSKEFGGKFAVFNKTVALTISGGPIVGANFDRLGLLLVNIGSNTIQIMPQTTVDLSKGLVLTNSGGSVSFTVRDDLVLVGWEWSGFASGAGSTLFVIEVIRIT